MVRAAETWWARTLAEVAALTSSSRCKVIIRVWDRRMDRMDRVWDRRYQVRFRQDKCLLEGFNILRIKWKLIRRSISIVWLSMSVTSTTASTISRSITYNKMPMARRSNQATYLSTHRQINHNQREQVVDLALQTSRKVKDTVATIHSKKCQVKMKVLECPIHHSHSKCRICNHMEFLKQVDLECRQCGLVKVVDQAKICFNQPMCKILWILDPT